MRCEHPRPFPIRLRFGRDDTHDRVDSLSPSLILKLTWTLCPPPPASTLLPLWPAGPDPGPQPLAWRIRVTGTRRDSGSGSPPPPRRWRTRRVGLDPAEAPFPNGPTESTHWHCHRRAGPLVPGPSPRPITIHLGPPLAHPLPPGRARGHR
jgi:hypothetical protein